MIVGGYSGEDWNDPEAWKEWIVAYTGWSDGQWNKFRNDWRDPDIDRDVLMYDTGVHIFNWDASGKGYDAKSASRRTSVEEALPLLDAQMAGMQDITLIGHSKGGNLVLNHVRSLDGRSSQVKNVVLIDALSSNDWLLPVARGSWAGRNVTGTDVNAVNIYNPADIVNSFALGFVRGATNYSQTVGQQVRAGDPEGKRIHSHKNHLAEQVLRVDLRVQFDQRGDYRIP